MQATTILTLPGWLGSSPMHWQSLWETTFGDVRVEQHDWASPLRGDWITHLEDALQNHLARQPEARIAFAAHSLGCHLVAAWAALSPNVHRVTGALLVAPPDPAMLELSPQLHSWKKPVLNKLPFKTTLVASTRDPFCSFAAAEGLAASWGSRMVSAGPIGHINADSGLQDWPAGRAMLMDLA
jgi:predicted alpha/beta hydrolase family esterase